MFKTWKKFAQPRATVETVEPVEVLPVLQRSLAYRRFLRTVFQGPARLNLVGHMREVEVIDVSLKGALVDFGRETHWPVGTRGRLRMLLSPTDFIAMDVVITRAQGSRVGLKCTHIDLDSVTHLRQLVERNAQDPALLGRELGFLAGCS